MKKTVLFLIFLLSLTLSYSQSPKDPTKETLCGLTNEDFFTKSDIVINGVFMGPVGFYETTVDGKTDSNIIFAYQIGEIFKGDQALRGQTIYVVKRKVDEVFFRWHYSIYGTVPSPPTPDIVRRHGKEAVYGYGKTSIYFLSKSVAVTDDIPAEYSEKIPSEYRYDFLCGDSNRLFVFEDKILGLNDLVFQNRFEMHNYMKQFEGFRTPGDTPPVKKGNTFSPSQPIEMDSLTRIKLDDMQGKSKKKALTHPAKSGTNDLNLEIGNQQLTYDQVEDRYYIDFDLLVSSNNPAIYLDVTHVIIGYNISLFGNYALSNGTVTITPGALFANGNNYAFRYLADITQRAIAFTLAPDRNNPNRITLDSVPVPLAHYKFEVQPCIAPTLACFYFTGTTMSASYTLTSHAPELDYYYYDYLYYYDPPCLPLATDGTPIITTDLSAISKIAGVSDTLTIRGCNFGEERGFLYFTAADQGGLIANPANPIFLKGLDNQYLSPVWWSDTLIKVIVPSMVYEGYGNDVPNYSGGAGTGPIKIKTLAGDSCVSTTSLQIPYSITNARSGELIYRTYLARRDCDYDMQFTLHSDYNNPIHATKVAIIDSALRHWSTLTGLTIRLERDASGNIVYTNTVGSSRNVIAPMPSSENSSYSMIASRKYGAIRPNNVLISYLDVGTHIYIRDNPTGATWNYAFSGNIPAGNHNIRQKSFLRHRI